MFERQRVSRIWLSTTLLYFAAMLTRGGLSTGWTFRGAMGPLDELLWAPIFFSFGGWGIYRRVASWKGAEIDKSQHPVSFWVITFCIFFLGLMLLIWGLQTWVSRDGRREIPTRQRAIVAAIRSAREAAGLSQRQLSTKLGEPSNWI